MTLWVLAAGWLGMAIMVSPWGIRRIVWGFGPSFQNRLLLITGAGFAAIPIALLVASLSRNLAEVAPMGSALSRCGRLIAAVMAEPLERPDLTLSLVLLAAFVLGLGWGTVSAWRSQSSSNKLARRSGRGLVLVPSVKPPAFTTGLLRPRIVVSQGFICNLPAEQKRVILAHEEAHRRRRHPLALFFLETLARGIPLPPIRWAADAYRLSIELTADEYAASVVGNRESVAETIAGVALQTSATPGFSGDEVIRVQRLLNPPAPRPIAVAFLLAGMAAAILLLAGGHAVHCGESSINALSVTQCRIH